jgi:hypothetical protein
MIDAASLRELSRHVGGFDMPVALEASVADADVNPEASAAAAAAFPLAYWGPDQSVHQVPTTRAIRSILGESGLLGGMMPAQSASDFRDRASAATTAIIGPWPESGLAGIEGVDASLCSPAETDPRPVLKRLSSLEVILSYVFLGCCIAGSASIYITAGFRESGDRPSADLSRFVGRSIGTFGILILIFQIFGFRWFQGRRLLRRFARRSGSLLTSPNGDRLVIRLEDAATFHLPKFTPEDWCVCALDPVRRRLLIEGVSHRYVVRAQDVVGVWPVPRGSSTSIFIQWRVGAEELLVALNRPNMGHVFLYTLSRSPLIGLPLRPFSGHGSMKLARKFVAALGIPITAEPRATPAVDSDVDSDVAVSA